MNRKEMQRQLEDLAERLGAKVIYDDLSFPGGHCRSRGQFYIVVNERLALEQKVRIMCAAISDLPWESQEVPPELQNVLIRKTV